MTKTFVHAAVAAALCASAVPAAAFSTFLDEVLVVRSGSNYFRDTFGDGNPPPTAEANTGVCGALAPNCWSVFGSFPTGSESGGKLRLDTANGLPSTNSAGVPVIVQQIRLSTNRTDLPEDATAGLKIGRTFSASALFDLAVPGPGDSYILRFSDVYANDAAPGHRNDVLQIQVRTSTVPGETAQISLRKQNFQTDTITSYGSTPLDLGLGADQIRLTLSHMTIGSTEVFGSWQYLAGGNVVGSGSFDTPGTIFSDETWTRVDVLVSAVPEPGTWATMLAGLALLGWSQRRRVASPV